MPGELQKTVQTGRKMPTAAESLLWTQRIEKEDMVNGRAKAQFSVRHAVSVVDVPAKFKPGHTDPTRDDKGLQGFDPAACGWDPDGPEARELRRCFNGSRACPRERLPYPATSSQDHGWLLGPPGSPAQRVRRKKDRMGIGWECKPPSEWSQSTALPPPFPRAEASHRHEAELQAGGAAGSRVSAAPAGSVLSSMLPDERWEAADAQASAVSAAAPTQLSRVSDASASELSRSTSLPAIRANPIERLRWREERLGKALAQSARFLNKGDCGSLYSRPLGMTDATKFCDDFVKANSGVPLYKSDGPQEAVLKDAKLGGPAQKWR